jgi:DNA ligase (NAD+)
MTPAERHVFLSGEIAKHDHQYYVLDAPEITDREYDALFDQLKELEREHPGLVHPSSPTQRIGERPREGALKVEHAQAMFSLDNTYGEAELREFDRRVRDGLGAAESFAYVAEPKLDGASLEVVFRDGVLALGATRGDGHVGEDVTANVRTIRALRLAVAERRTLTLRGEVVLFKRDLVQINRQRIADGEEPFANPRNTAAGWLRLLDSRETAKRPLRLFFYELVEPYYPTHHEALKALASMGLPTHGRERLCASLEQVLRYIDELDEQRKQLPYETDGVVVKVDRIAQRALLGTTTRFPRWAIAYKYAAERALTVVRAIETDLGRTGALTPVAVLDPVPLSGTVVSRASLHNIDYVAEKDVRVGDTVSIEKAGEIIPQVISVSLEHRPLGTAPWKPPEACPVCGTAVAREGDEAALRCPNPRCKGRIKAGIFHFTRRTAMDVDHLGWALIDQLVDHGLLADFGDVFALPARREALLALERMADKSADNLLLAIEKAKHSRTFGQLLFGLGIPHVGSVAAKVIAERYKSLDALLSVALEPERLRTELSASRGIGPKIADSVASYFADEHNRKVANKLLELGVRARQPEASHEQGQGALCGASFCVTGTLSRPREEIHALIRENGGEIHQRVGKGTTYLVAGDKVGQSKLTAAEKRGTKVITEAELEARVAGGMGLASES